MPPPSFYFHIILCSQGIHEVIYDKDLEDRQAQGGSLIFLPAAWQPIRPLSRVWISSPEVAWRRDFEGGKAKDVFAGDFFLGGRNDVQQKIITSSTTSQLFVYTSTTSQIWSYEHLGQFLANICRNHTSEDLKKTPPRCRVHMGWHFLVIELNDFAAQLMAYKWF